MLHIQSTEVENVSVRKSSPQTPGQCSLHTLEAAEVQ